MIADAQIIALRFDVAAATGEGRRRSGNPGLRGHAGERDERADAGRADARDPAAANSLREGLEECFTLNRLGIPPSLHRCLATTNLIESPQSASGHGPGESAAGAMRRWSRGPLPQTLSARPEPTARPGSPPMRDNTAPPLWLFYLRRRYRRGQRSQAGCEFPRVFAAIARGCRRVPQTRDCDHGARAKPEAGRRGTVAAYPLRKARSTRRLQTIIVRN